MDEPIAVSNFDADSKISPLQIAHRPQSLSPSPSWGSCFQVACIQERNSQNNAPKCHTPGRGVCAARGGVRQPAVGVGGPPAPPLQYVLRDGERLAFRTSGALQVTAAWTGFVHTYEAGRQLKWWLLSEPTRKPRLAWAHRG